MSKCKLYATCVGKQVCLASKCNKLWLRLFRLVMLRSHARFDARQSESHVNKLYCYIIRILLLHVWLTVCSFVPRGSNCMPGTKMATVANGTNNSLQKASIEHRGISTAVPFLSSFCIQLICSSHSHSYTIYTSYTLSFLHRLWPTHSSRL